MKEDKNYFISISAGAMGGENGILEKLNNERYKVEKVKKWLFKNLSLWAKYNLIHWYYISEVHYEKIR